MRDIDPVTISYTPGTNRIQDPAGNTAAAISNMTVRNSAVSPVGTESFEITDRGGVSITSSGMGGAARSGYARIRADAGSTTPSGVAIFAFRDSAGVLISEAGVPATETVMEGRIFAEVYGPSIPDWRSPIRTTIRQPSTSTLPTPVAPVSGAAASSWVRTSRWRNS